MGRTSRSVDLEAERGVELHPLQGEALSQPREHGRRRNVAVQESMKSMSQMDDAELARVSLGAEDTEAGCDLHPDHYHETQN